MTEAIARIVAYSDGACSGNPGPGGWGVVVAPRSPGDPPLEGYGFGGSRVTNNAMEILAATRALEIVAERGLTGPITIRTDSEHVVKGMTEWLPNWRRNGWKTAAKKPVSNRERWERLVALTDAMDVRFEWVRGHNQDKWNERTDRLAVLGCRAATVGERGKVTLGDERACEDPTAKPSDAVVSLRLPIALVEAMDAIAKARNLDRAGVASAALRLYLNAGPEDMA